MVALADVMSSNEGPPAGAALLEHPQEASAATSA
jgi:hypothetical protein